MHEAFIPTFSPLPTPLQVGMPARQVREQYGNETLNRVTGSVAGGKSYVYAYDTGRKKPLDVTEKPLPSEEIALCLRFRIAGPNQSRDASRC